MTVPNQGLSVLQCGGISKEPGKVTTRGSVQGAPGVRNVAKTGAPNQVDGSIAEGSQREGDFATVEEVFGKGDIAYVEDGIFDRPMRTQVLVALRRRQVRATGAARHPEGGDDRCPACTPRLLPGSALPSRLQPLI